MDRIKSLVGKLYTRKCKGCDDPSFHTAHLTRLGTLHYVGRF